MRRNSCAEGTPVRTGWPQWTGFGVLEPNNTVPHTMLMIISDTVPHTLLMAIKMRCGPLLPPT